MGSCWVVENLFFRAEASLTQNGQMGTQRTGEALISYTEGSF